MVYNVILYIICGIALSSWALPLYSIVTYAVAVKVVDAIVEGLDRAKGAYSNEEKTMIYFVVSRFQVARMREIVHSIDEKAYITISEVADVFSATSNS